MSTTNRLLTGEPPDFNCEEKDRSIVSGSTFCSLLATLLELGACDEQLGKQLNEIPESVYSAV